MPKKKKSKKNFKKTRKRFNYNTTEQSNDLKFGSLFTDNSDNETFDLTDEEEKIIVDDAKKAEPSVFDRPLHFYKSTQEFPADAINAVVTSVHRRHFVCLSNSVSYICFLPRQLLIREHVYKHPVAVGDKVSIQRISQAQNNFDCILDGILTRKSVLSRTANFRSQQEQIIAANVDQMFIVVASAYPALNLHLIDRMIVVAERSGIECIICINKTDLESETDPMEAADLYTKLGYKVLLMSALKNQGILEMKKLLTDKISVLTGPSGVGKSSILNKIQPELAIKINGVSQKTRKGRHTTSFATMHPLDFGGFVIDTPGIKSFGLFDLTKPELIEYFPEMTKYLGKCKFNNCSHTGIEKECALINAVEQGIVDARRHESYIAIFDTLPD